MEYKTTEEYRAKVRAYQQSDKGKERLKKYKEDGKMAQASDRYRKSFRGRQKVKEYFNSKEGKEYLRQAYKLKIYRKLKKYIIQYTDDNYKDILDKKLTPSELRQQFKNKYGLKVYKQFQDLM